MAVNWDDTGSATRYQTYQGYGTLTYPTGITGDTDTVMLTTNNVLQFLNDVTMDATYQSDVTLFQLPAGFRPSYKLHALVLYTKASTGSAAHTFHMGVDIGTTGDVYKHDDSVTLEAGDVVHFKGLCVNLACNHYMNALPVQPTQP